MRRCPLLPLALALIAGILLAHNLACLSARFWLWALAANAILIGALFAPPLNA